MPVRKDVDEIIEKLNEIYRADPVAIRSLVEHRVPCSGNLVDHDTVQIGHGRNHGLDSDFRIGMMGVINGICGAYDDGPRAGYGAVGAMYDDDKMVGFVLVENL